MNAPALNVKVSVDTSGLDRGLDDAKKKTKQAANDVGQAADKMEKELAQAANKGGKSMQDLAAKTKRAGSAMQSSLKGAKDEFAGFADDMAKSVPIIGGFLSKMGMVGIAAGAAVGGILAVNNQIANLGKQAKIAGVSVEAFQRWGNVFKTAGIPLDALQDGLKELNMRTAEFLRTGSGAGGDALKMLGFTESDMRKGLTDMDQFMTDVINRMRKLDTASQRFLGEEIFGGQAGEQLPLILALAADEIDRMRAKPIIADEDIKRAEELQRKMQEIGNDVNNWISREVVTFFDGLYREIDRFRNVEDRRPENFYIPPTISFGGPAAEKTPVDALQERLAEVNEQINQIKMELSGEEESWTSWIFGLDTEEAKAKLAELEAIAEKVRGLIEQENKKAAEIANPTPPATIEPMGPIQGPSKKEFEEWKKERDKQIKELEQQVKQADDVLANSMIVNGAAGLDGFAAQLKLINADYDRQIELVKDNEEAVKKLNEARQLDLETARIQQNKALFDPQTDQMELLQAQAGTVFQNEDSQRRATVLAQANIDLRRQGLDLSSQEAEAFRNNAMALSDYEAEILKMKDAWMEVQEAAGGVIDAAVDGIMSGDFRGAIENIRKEVMNLFTEMAIKNPLKNMLTGTNLPTLNNLFAGMRGAPSLTSAATLGTPMNPMSVTVVGGIPGLTNIPGVGTPTNPFAASPVNAAPVMPVQRFPLSYVGAADVGDPSQPSLAPVVGGAAANLFGQGAPQLNNFLASIRKIESGSFAGNYQALGPVVKSGMYAGERALGAYQVMPGNLPQWSQQALGYQVTPEQFLGSKQIQDQIASFKLGGYLDKYGVSGGARAWFAGEGGMNNLTNSDGYTQVAKYGQMAEANMKQLNDVTQQAVNGVDGALNGNLVPGINNATQQATQGLQQGASQLQASAQNLSTSYFPPAPSGGKGGGKGAGAGKAAGKGGGAVPGGVGLYADGTDHAKSGMALVGEKGPELVMFGGGEKVMSARDTKSMLGGANSGSSFTNNISVVVEHSGNNNEQDLKMFGEQLSSVAEEIFNEKMRVYEWNKRSRF